ncbi:MAG: hypothetical protein AAGN82_13965 [Myxococcota bacterium]
MRFATYLLGITFIAASCSTAIDRRRSDDDDDGGGQGGAGLFFGGGNNDEDDGGSGGANPGPSGGMGVTNTTATGVGAGTTTSGGGFDDDDGGGATTTTTTSTTTTTGGGPANCVNAPNCGQCFCDQDPVGCQAFDTAVVDHIACGVECGTSDCATFCADTTMPVDLACDSCVTNNANNADITAFQSACGAACLGFANNLQMCP